MCNGSHNQSSLNEEPLAISFRHREISNQQFATEIVTFNYMTDVQFGQTSTLNRPDRL
jgi:hypothetical protein